MNILFSFESKRMPIRATTLINWLQFRGHSVTVLYNEGVCHDDMEGRDVLCNFNILTKIDDYNSYDIWFADLLNYKNYTSTSEYLPDFKKFNNTLCIISFDDGPEFFNHRLDPEVKEKISCWLNNLIEKDKSIYDKSIQDRCMLIPTYIEASNENYDELTNIHKIPVKPYCEKLDWVYFSGAITGCKPCIDCRSNSILHAIGSGLQYTVRVTGTDPAPFLKYMYDNYIPDSLKISLVDKTSYLNELNNFKFILSPKGNCQPVRRQYESFAFNNLVFINENNTVDYLFEGTPNVHFVQYKLDCSDLKEKLRYYISNVDAAVEIANAGTEFWHKNCRIFSSGDISPSLSEHLVRSFKNITSIEL
jgi:hypothetical protein